MIANCGRGHVGSMVSFLVAVVGAAGLIACSDSDGDMSPGTGGGDAGASETAGGGGKSGAPGGGSAGHEIGGMGGDTAAGEGGTDLGGAPMSVAGAPDAGAPAEAGAPPVPPVPPVVPAILTELRALMLSPLPALPVDTTNAVADNPAAAVLGQELFFDKRYSGALKVAGDLGIIGDTGKLSCATCHSGPAMSDGRTPFKVTLGTDLHTRNAPALVNSSFYTWTNWAGRFAAQWELPPAVAENPLTMNGNRLRIAHFIYDHRKAEYEALFGALEPALSPTASVLDAARFPADGKPKAAGASDGPWEGMAPADQVIVNKIFANYGKALEAYMRKLVSRGATFDQYIANGTGISASAINGADLFIHKAKCISCHNGADFTDNKFHNLGVPQTGADYVPAADDGRFKDATAELAATINVNSSLYSDDPNSGRLASLTNPVDAATHSQFRSASLRNVALTGPYMHSGQFATLADVVTFYVAGGGAVTTGTTKDALLTPVALTDTEQADLIEFLKTLSGPSVSAALLLDTSGQ
jgi:cytochrome c peroxidase